MKILIIIALSLVILTACNHQNKAKPGEEVKKEMAQQDRMLHCWDAFPYTDAKVFTDSMRMKQTLVDWVQQVAQQPDSTAYASARSAITAGHGKPEGQKAMFLWMESLLNDPNSPFRNEELFIPVLEAMTKDSQLADIDRERPRFLLRQAMKNRKGTLAANLSFLTQDGQHRSLYDITAENVLIYFFNPDCHDCKRVGDILRQHPLLLQLQQQGRLQIVAIYPDEDLTAWKKMQYTYPLRWIVGRIDNAQERKKYVLPAIPSLYLLDSHHTVLLKDATIEAIIAWLNKV